MAGLFSVIINGWQERIGDSPPHPVGWFAAQVVPSPTRPRRAVERLRRHGAKPKLPMDVQARLAAAPIKWMMFSSMRRVCELMRIPLTDHDRVLALKGVSQTYVFLSGLIFDWKRIRRDLSSLGLPAQVPEPRLWLRQHVALIGVHPDGGVEFVADLAGLPLVSAIFGASQGWLRTCRSCYRLFTPMRKDAFRQRVCDAHGRDGPAPYYATRLSPAAQQMWRRDSKRVSMRLKSYLVGEQARAAYRAWRAGALPDLRQRDHPARNGTEKDRSLKTWEEQHVARVPTNRLPASMRETQKRWALSLLQQAKGRINAPQRW